MPGVPELFHNPRIGAAFGKPQFAETQAVAAQSVDRHGQPVARRAQAVAELQGHILGPLPDLAEQLVDRRNRQGQLQEPFDQMFLGITEAVLGELGVRRLIIHPVDLRVFFQQIDHPAHRGEAAPGQILTALSRFALLTRILIAGLLGIDARIRRNRFDFAVAAIAVTVPDTEPGIHGSSLHGFMDAFSDVQLI